MILTGMSRMVLTGHESGPSRDELNCPITGHESDPNWDELNGPNWT